MLTPEQIDLRRRWSAALRSGEYKQTMGHLRTDKHAVVTFELKDISDLELFDFSRQNVLASLEVARDGKAVHILLHPSYGLGGRIDAGQVVVSLTPGKPTVG